jgi:hypothetical protein
VHILIPDTSPSSGGVVSNTYFQGQFGLLNADGTKNQSRTDAVSSNVVSVLQAGAFFGALGSSAISREYNCIVFHHRTDVALTHSPDRSEVYPLAILDYL